jgi:hypothetical protein
MNQVATVLVIAPNGHGGDFDVLYTNVRLHTRHLDTEEHVTSPVMQLACVAKHIKAHADALDLVLIEDNLGSDGAHLEKAIREQFPRIRVKCARSNAQDRAGNDKTGTLFTFARRIVEGK